MRSIGGMPLPSACCWLRSVCGALSLPVGLNGHRIRRGSRRADRPGPTASATNSPQPLVPSSIATGLRDPYMSLCQRGSIVSSAPRRSNCTALLAPVLALLRPRSALAHPEHRLLVELERQRTVVLEHDLLDQLAGGVPDDERQRARPDLDVERCRLVRCSGRASFTHAQRRRRIRARRRPPGALESRS